MSLILIVSVGRYEKTETSRHWNYFIENALLRHYCPIRFGRRRRCRARGGTKEKAPAAKKRFTNKRQIIFSLRHWPLSKVVVHNTTVLQTLRHAKRG